LYFSAPEGLDEGDGNFALEIVPHPGKDGVLKDRKNDKKVSGRAAVLAHLPLSGYPQAGSLLRTGGSLDGEGLGSL
jgi:hypothetical protein